MLSTECLIIHNDLCLRHNNKLRMPRSLVPSHVILSYCCNQLPLVKSTSGSTMELEFTNESTEQRSSLESPPNSSQLATLPTGVDFSLAIQPWSLWSLDRSCHSPSTKRTDILIDISTELRSHGSFYDSLFSKLFEST
jgi:hypothetical protein